MKAALGVDKAVELIIQKAEEQLGGEGRILVRASGTEPIIRVMIEGKDQAQIEAMCAAVSDQLEERLSQNEDLKRMAGY
jgi:phosphoglucosamine mutase